jgi:hypothetical protein
MYHTRPIKTYDLLTALSDRVSHSLTKPLDEYDDVLSNTCAESRKELLKALLKFNDDFLEGRDA